MMLKNEKNPDINNVLMGAGGFVGSAPACYGSTLSSKKEIPQKS
jgi:hypothetical protein